MPIIITLFIIGISLSMDTFSMFLSFGTFPIPKIKIIIFCIIVGIMHFIMPIIGVMIGERIVNILSINTNILLGIILIFISIEMLIDIKEDKDNVIDFSYINIFILSFSVSIDSFSTGLGLSSITTNTILASFIFSFCAIIFSYLGYLIGKYTKEHIGFLSSLLGIILLFTLGILQFFK